MRLRELRLEAFGPFDGQVIDFGSRHEPDFHVVLGLNEAGKTSALRAIQALLFGVPVRTPDAFMHAYDAIRVGALLELADGTELELTRVKANKRDLRDANDQPLSDDVLRAALGGISEDLFRRLFLVSHQELRRGGEGLAAGGADYGVSLFGAALGAGNVGALRTQLQRAADELFRPGGSRPTLNTALKRYQDHRKQAVELAVRPRAYEDARQRAHELGERRATQERKVHALERERAALERLRRIVGPLARHHQVRDQLVTLADVPVLALDATSAREHGIERLDRALKAHADAVADRDTQLDELKRLAVDQPLLAREPEIRALEQQLGQHDAALADRSKREQEYRELHERAHQLRLRAGVAPELALEPPRPESVASINTLSDQHATLRERERQAEAERQARREAYQAAKRELDHAAAPDELPSGLVDWAHELEERLPELVSLRDRQRAAEDELAQLRRGGLALTPTVDLADAAIVAPPLSAIEAYTEVVGTLLRELDAARAERERLVGRINSEREQLASVSAGGAPALTDRLSATRERRDLLLERLRDALATGEVEVARELADELPGLLRDADDTADALVAQADSVLLAKQLTARLAELSEQHGQVAARLLELEQRQEQERRLWLELWASAGVVPLDDPRAMSAWHVRQHELRVHHDELVAQRDSLGRRVAEHEAVATELATVLRSVGASVEEGLPEARLLARARSVLQRGQQATVAYAQMVSQHDRASEELEQAEAVQAQVKAELEVWATDWHDALAGLPVAADAAPALARELLVLLADIVNAEAQAAQLKHRIDAITTDYAVFAARVAELTAALAPDLAEADALVALRALTQRLGQQLAARALHDQLEERRRGAEQRIGEQEREIDAAHATLNRLIEVAGCASLDELPAVEVRAAERRGLAEEQAELERRIVAQGEHSLAELEAELAGRDGDALAAELERVDTALSADQAERDRLIEQHTLAIRERDAMDHAAQAADAREAAEQAAGEVADVAGRYLRTRAAEVLLAHAIEHHRERSATPVLARAQELLPLLTDGSLVRLFPELSDAGTTGLRAARLDGRELSVEQLSDGTRDQLYLALRLAALEHQLDALPPLPILLDDILVHYDEQRVAKALPALASVARRSQVIMLTHHRHVAEIAARTLADDVRLHELQRMT